SDQTSRGQSPPEVSLDDLVKRGYLTTNDVHGVDGMSVTFSTHFDDRRPQLILARALQPDGQVVCLLNDGSDQQFSPQSYKEYSGNLSQPGGATNGTR